MIRSTIVLLVLIASVTVGSFAVVADDESKAQQLVAIESDAGESQGVIDEHDEMTLEKGGKGGRRPSGGSRPSWSKPSTPSWNKPTPYTPSTPSYPSPSSPSYNRPHYVPTYNRPHNSPNRNNYPNSMICYGVNSACECPLGRCDMDRCEYDCTCNGGRCSMYGCKGLGHCTCDGGGCTGNSVRNGARSMLLHNVLAAVAIGVSVLMLA